MIYSSWWKGLAGDCFFLINNLKCVMRQSHNELQGGFRPARTGSSSPLTLSSLLVFRTPVSFAFLSVFSLSLCSRTERACSLWTFPSRGVRAPWICARSRFHCRSVTSGYWNRVRHFTVLLSFPPDSPEWPHSCENLRVHRFRYLNLHLRSRIWLYGKSGMFVFLFYRYGIFFF